MSHPAPAPYQPYDPPSHSPSEYGPPAYGPPPKKGAGLAISSMVLGIIALLLSWIPIINNVAAVLALVGLGLGIPAIIRARKGTGGGTGMAITGLVTSVLALVLVIVTQLFFLKVIDEVDEAIDASISESQEAPVAPVDATAEEDAGAAPETVPFGVPTTVGDYEVTVNGVLLDGNAVVAEANDFNEPPTGQYVIVGLTATYVGTEEGMPGFDLTAIFHGSDARQYSDSECSAILPDDAMDSPTLNSGGSDTFQFCMDVPPAAITGGQLSIEPTISFDDDARVYFATS